MMAHDDRLGRARAASLAGGVALLVGLCGLGGCFVDYIPQISPIWGRAQVPLENGQVLRFSYERRSRTEAEASALARRAWTAFCARDPDWICDPPETTSPDYPSLATAPRVWMEPMPRPRCLIRVDAYKHARLKPERHELEAAELTCTARGPKVRHWTFHSPREAVSFKPIKVIRPSDVDRRPD